MGVGCFAIVVVVFLLGVPVAVLVPPAFALADIPGTPEEEDLNFFFAGGGISFYSLWEIFLS